MPSIKLRFKKKQQQKNNAVAAKRSEICTLVVYSLLFFVYYFLFLYANGLEDYCPLCECPKKRQTGRRSDSLEQRTGAGRGLEN